MTLRFLKRQEPTYDVRRNDDIADDDDDDDDVDGYCGGGTSNDRCGDRNVKNERNVYGRESSDVEEEPIEVLVKFSFFFFCQYGHRK